MLERILTRRYGEPMTTIREGFVQRCWNSQDFYRSAALYPGMKWNSVSGLRLASLKDLYGDALGGYLVKNTFKVSVLMPRDIWGLWNIDELRMLPAVQYVSTLDPAIDFFMDEDNVLFYGLKNDELWVFDDEHDELDNLGPIEAALETLLDDHFKAIAG
jgi:hypothetical protein